MLYIRNQRAAARRLMSLDFGGIYVRRLCRNPNATSVSAKRTAAAVGLTTGTSNPAS
jgi:hypothetical protein